jgi:hypothetical protein
MDRDICVGILMRPRLGLRSEGSTIFRVLLGREEAHTLEASIHVEDITNPFKIV